MTIHGKSRYPGLYAWTREGKKISVSVPDGCLLVQSGKQFEYLTGGYVMAGYHEVVVTDQTLEAINKRKAEGKSLWRVSSTLFSHVASDAVLEPLDCALFNEHVSASDKQFPAIEAGQFVKEELEVINLLDTK